MTPIQKYDEQVKISKELFEAQRKQSEELLRESQKNCKHKFGKLHQIGWVPDIEIMGYSCELCGFQKRQNVRFW